MADGLGADIGLGHRAHLDGGLHPDLYALLLQHVGHGQGVDGSGQHTHVVGAGAVHASRVPAAEKVAAPDHDPDLGPERGAFFDTLADAAHDAVIDAEFFLPGEGFPAELQQDPFILQWHT